LSSSWRHRGFFRSINPFILNLRNRRRRVVEASWNAMAHAQKPHFVFRRNGRNHLNRRVRQFNWLLTAEVCASAVVMLDTPCSEVVWRELATHSIRHFPLHFPSRASPCPITFQLESKVQDWPALLLDRTWCPRNRRLEGTQRASWLLGE
jgi:hypothetical protein